MNKGVLQGRVLCPTLFNIVVVGLVNELPRSIHASIYADSIRVWASAVSRVWARARLQQAVVVIHKYLQRCRFQLSIDKYSLLVFTRRSIEKYPVFIRGQKIPILHKQMLIGVVIERGLT